MRLHEDKEAFSDLVQAAAESIGLPQVHVEKDYWVTMALKYLAESDHFNEVVFKGGTSLSKGYRLISRFSEDIDLAIFSGDAGKNKRKKLLKSTAARFRANEKFLKRFPAWGVRPRTWLFRSLSEKRLSRLIRMFSAFRIGWA